MRWRRERWWPLVLGGLVLACTGCRGHGDGGARQDARRPASAVEVLEVAVERVAERRQLFGDVDAWRMIPLSFKVGGRIARLTVEEGDRVERGQLVALLDARDYRLQRDLARAQVEALQPHLERTRQLVRERALPRAKLDEIEGKMNAARIQRSQARAQLSYARLRAPLGAIVLQKRVSVGDLVGPTRPVVVLADLRRVKVILPVAQRDLRHFSRGMAIELTARGLPGTFRGEVHSVGYAADKTTRTFPVTVKVPNPAPHALRVGMIVEARVTVTTHEGIFVPLDLVSRDEHGAPRVLLARKGRAVERAVELGPLVGQRVRVVKGLAPGDAVIQRGLVNPGDRVAIGKAGALAGSGR